MSITSIRTKVSAFADKVSNSKVYKIVERGAVVGSAALMSVGISAVNAFAVDEFSVSVDTADILNKAQPFITPAITILCCVGGMKLGMRFLRSSMH